MCTQDTAERTDGRFGTVIAILADFDTRDWENLLTAMLFLILGAIPTGIVIYHFSLYLIELLKLII